MTQTAHSPQPHYQPQYAQPPTSHPNNSNLQLQTQPAPPPYQEFNQNQYQNQNQRPGVHFAPTPSDPHQRHSFSGQRPPQQSWNSYGPPTQPQPQYQHRPSQDYGMPPNVYGSSPSKAQYLAPHMRPYAQPNSSQYSLENGGYSSDPEPHRRRHKHSSRRDSGSDRDMKSKYNKSRSTNADAFLGAAGGGLIGDLIFPGLGTVGGAAIGWLGGRDYGHHRKGREDKRAVEQRKWEDKFRPALHHKNRSRGHSNGSSQLGERDDHDRYDKYDRRHSEY